MNREILFRGKDENGNWHEGSLVVDIKQQCSIINYSNRKTECYPWHDVIFETVGQFTGLLDKNGVRIFEGDIVKTTKRIGVCVFYLGCFVIDDLKKTSDHDISSPSLWEVIGNIHDNQNLLTK